jgi:plasmid stabilization system protein ParE
MTVIWTEQAQQSFWQILAYLQENWNREIALNFVDLVDDTISKLMLNPEMFEVSRYHADSRAAPITKHTTLFYRIIDNTIEIEYFWSNAKNPDTLF